MTGSATKRSGITCLALDCFAEPVIGPAKRPDPLARNDGVGSWSRRNQKTAGALTPPFTECRYRCAYIPISKTLGS